MFLVDDYLDIEDPATKRTWHVPVREITAVDADVSERWMVNARLHPRRFREIVPAPFLEPQLVDDSVVLALCAIRMRHAAPIWAPLNMGPASMNCALRVACRDTRTGTPVVWVANRYTDSVLAPALGKLGFPQVYGGLRDLGGPGRLDLRAGDGLVQVSAAPGGGPSPELFPDAAQLGAFIAAGVRSYGPGSGPGRYAVVDLEKRADNVFHACHGWEGRLRTPWGDCTVDGVYLTTDGIYRWTSHGQVDQRGMEV